MSENNYQIHWDSTIYNINPEVLRSYEGIIINSQYNILKGIPALIVTVRRNIDDLESKILFTHHASMFEDENLENTLPLIPKAISELYKDFVIEDFTELEGKRILGTYFNQKLAGIQKNS